MKPILILTTTAAISAVVWVAGASAFGVGDYNGHVRHDPPSHVGFDLNRNAAGHRVVSLFTVGNVKDTCEGGSSGRSGGYTVEKNFRIRHREFGGKVNVVEGGLDPVLRVHGKLRRGGGVAVGTIRLHGELDQTQPGVQCHTGELEWRAPRVPH
jgi:hypothetical protein